MHKLITQKKAPPGAIVPLIINPEGVFKLDVDDEIWQDIGLDDSIDGPPPRWLCDEAVRGGIKAMLELDRCQEEENRLRSERCAMQEWLQEEWNTVVHAREKTGILYYHCKWSSTLN